MKELQGRASAELDVPARKCFELLATRLTVSVRALVGASQRDHFGALRPVLGGGLVMWGTRSSG